MSKKQTSSPTAAKPMSFSEALQQVVAGRNVTRTGWAQPHEWLFMRGGFLHVRKPDGMEHTLAVSEGDITATDWVVV